MTKKIVFILIIVVAVIVAGYFLTKKQPTPSGGVIRLGSFSRTISFAPYFIAKNKGWFEEIAKKYNATVEYTEFQSLPPINEAFATDKIDLVFEAEIPVIVGRAAGIEIQIAHLFSKYIQELVIPKNSTIQSANDLKGRKVAVRAGSSSHYVINKLLTQNGLTLNDIELIDMAPEDAKAAFETGQVDAWAIWPPFIEQEELSGKGRTLPGSAAFVQVVMVGRSKFLLGQPELTKDLIEVVSKTQNWIVDNEKEAQTILAQELKLPVEVIEKAWPRHDFAPTLGDSEIADIQAKADFLQGLGLIKNKVNASELVYVR